MSELVQACFPGASGELMLRIKMVVIQFAVWVFSDSLCVHQWIMSIGVLHGM